MLLLGLLPWPDTVYFPVTLGSLSDPVQSSGCSVEAGEDVVNQELAASTNRILSAWAYSRIQDLAAPLGRAVLGPLNLDISY